jgi:hypothetical protein
VEFVEDTVEGAAELHRVFRAEGDVVFVDAGEGVVDDSPGAAVALGNDASGGEAELSKLSASQGSADGGVGEDHPLACRDHGSHLSAEEVAVLSSRFVCASMHGCVEALECPGGRLLEDGCPSLAQAREVRACRVRQVLEVVLKARRAASFAAQLAKASTAIDEGSGEFDGLTKGIR